MRRILSVLCCTALLVVTALTAPAPAMDMEPGKGVTVKPARATWNTGFFQEALVRRGLEELGYDVQMPKDLQNTIAYKSIALGDMDYWANGWFPIHDSQMPDDFYEHAEKVGYVVEAGGIQGYLVSKREADKFDITSLADFKRPEVREAFDRNSDGKADMVACPMGWGCETTISFHLKQYGLEDSINPITAAYEASIADALGAYKNGEAVLMYTWGPNWTLFKFKPGEDVVWINVPEIIPRDSQAQAVDRMTVSGIEGAATDPVKLGFVVSDIQIVANSKFLNANPAARKFFEEFTLSLDDINAQNTRMNEGEKSDKDIARHVDEWIAANQDTWNGWLDAARKAAK